jgi:3-oxoadipate enol-lactonase
VITPDIRGHGRSPHQKTITVNGVVDDIEALLNHLSIDRYHVLGISMGGIFALSYYRRHPQKIRSLMLADSYATLGEIGQIRVAAAEERWTGGIDMVAFGREYAADCLLPTTPRTWHEELAAAIAQVQQQAYLETMRAIYLEDVSEVLPLVRVPTLVLVGERDHRTPISFSEVLVQKIPGARLVIIPEAKHLSNLDNPTAFNAAVLDFLNSLSS